MKTQLEPDEIELLAAFRSGGQKVVPILNRLMKENLDELKDIRGVDSKGNIGLQTLARQIALNNLEELYAIFFPDLIQAPVATAPGQAKRYSQWQ